MHSQLTVMWDQLVESGINQYIERLTLEVYKSSRQEWIQTRLSAISKEESVLTTNSALIVSLLVLCLGYTTAGLAFIFELILHY